MCAELAKSLGLCVRWWLQELAKVFNTDVNGLPLSLDISWFEQKAVAVLLTLLHLGVKNIRWDTRGLGLFCVYRVYSSPSCAVLDVHSGFSVPLPCRQPSAVEVKEQPSESEMD